MRCRHTGEPGWHTFYGRRGGEHCLYTFYTLRELGDRFPSGHPVVRRGKQGKPILARKQVWVERTSGRLWIIVRIEREETGKRVVQMRPFNYGRATRTLAERTLRLYMRIWDDAVEARRRIRERERQAGVPPVPVD